MRELVGLALDRFAFEEFVDGHDDAAVDGLHATGARACPPGFDGAAHDEAFEDAFEVEREVDRVVGGDAGPGDDESVDRSVEFDRTRRTLPLHEVGDEYAQSGRS